MKTLEIIAICIPFIASLLFTTILAYSGKKSQSAQKKTPFHKDEI